MWPVLFWIASCLTTLFLGIWLGATWALWSDREDEGEESWVPEHPLDPINLTTEPLIVFNANAQPSVSKGGVHAGR